MAPKWNKELPPALLIALAMFLFLLCYCIVIP
jgi:hypothetical protein